MTLVKKIIPLLICAMITFATIGTTTPESAMAAPTTQNTKVKEFHSKKDMFRYIMNEAKQFKPKIELKFYGDASNFKNELHAEFQKPGNDYINGAYKGYSYRNKRYVTGLNEITLELKYYVTSAQEAYVTNQVKAIAKSLNKAGMTDFDKVFAVNNYVVSKASYSKETKNTPHHVYTLLTEGKGVCQAYALLTHRLLQELGVESRYVVGVAKGENHAWNQVKVNGKWYHLDTTWNDLSDIWGNKNVRYQWFLTSSATMKKDHQWNESNYAPATDNRYSYMQDVFQGIYHNNKVYYSPNNKNQFFQLDVKTGKKVLLLNKRLYDYEAYGNNLYFADYSYGGYLGTYNLSTKKFSYIHRAYVKKLNISGNTLTYYVNNIKKTYRILQPTGAPSTSIVSITNNYGSAVDKMKYKNLTKGVTYKVYANANKGKLLYSFKANATTATFNVKLPTYKAGSLYITATANGKSESGVTKLNYSAERLPAVTAKNVTVSNKVKSDTITMKGLTKGSVYTIYTDATLKKKLTSFNATGANKTIQIKQLGKKAGSIYIVRRHSGYLNSPSTKVNYKAETK